MKLEDFLLKEEGDDSRHLPNGMLASTWDTLGHVWNIGPGLTHGVTKNTVWTPEQLAAAETAEFAATRTAVANLVKVPLGENQTTAVESLVYNIGVNGFAHSSVLRYINANNLAAVPDAFRLWNKADGKVCRGLINRREDEIRLWFHPDDAPIRPDLGTLKNMPVALSHDVRWVQENLNIVMGTKLAVDGDIGPKTRTVIRAFQAAHGLMVDGIAGVQTCTVLEAVLAAVAPAVANPTPAA